jgi:hypothetical protein
MGMGGQFLSSMTERLGDFAQMTTNKKKSQAKSCRRFVQDAKLNVDGLLQDPL